MNILLTGSVAYDYIMKFPGYFREHILPEHLGSISLSFLVESMVRQRGGIAPNIGYTLALLGERPRLWAAVGEDFEEYRQWLESVGIDASGARVIPGVFTASFFANFDQANAQIASFYPGAMAYASQLSLYELQANPPDLVVISPNDPSAMHQYVRECKELGIPYIYDPSQQIVRLSADELRAGLSGALALFVNEYEFALIEKITGLSAEAIYNEVGFVVITRGKQGTSIVTQAGRYDVPVFPERAVVDPTGVGDAFRGGFLKGYAMGLDWETCGRMGALAATYCLEQSGTQGQQYTPQEFVSRFREYFDDQGKLDSLMNKPTD
jgi:adenosine kinase